jgi:hypothetical protein
MYYHTMNCMYIALFLMDRAFFPERGRAIFPEAKKPLLRDRKSLKQRLLSQDPRDSPYY